MLLRPGLTDANTVVAVVLVDGAGDPVVGVVDTDLLNQEVTLVQADGTALIVPVDGAQAYWEEPNGSIAPGVYKLGFLPEVTDELEGTLVVVVQPQTPGQFLDQRVTHQFKAALNAPALGVSLMRGRQFVMADEDLGAADLYAYDEQDALIHRYELRGPDPDRDPEPEQPHEREPAVGPGPGEMTVTDNSRGYLSLDGSWVGVHGDPNDPSPFVYVATFSHPINAATVTPSTFVVTNAEGLGLPLDVQVVGNTITVTPGVDWSPPEGESLLTFLITRSIRSTTGHRLALPHLGELEFDVQTT